MTLCLEHLQGCHNKYSRRYNADRYNGITTEEVPHLSGAEFGRLTWSFYAMENGEKSFSAAITAVDLGGVWLYKYWFFGQDG